MDFLLCSNATLFSEVFTGKSPFVYLLVVVDVVDCGLLVTLATQRESSEDSLAAHYLEAMCQSVHNIADTFSFVFLCIPWRCGVGHQLSRQEIYLMLPPLEDTSFSACFLLSAFLEMFCCYHEWKAFGVRVVCSR